MKPRRLVMYPGFMSSSDAHEFKKTLGVLLVYRNGAYRPQRGDFIIGWGNSKEPTWKDMAWHNEVPVVNHWSAIRRAVNKDLTLTTLKGAGVNTVPFTFNRNDACKWATEGHTVVARTKLDGMKGSGIHIATKPADMPYAPLYTQFQPDCDEFRVHVAFGKVINFQQKKRKNGVKCDPYVRSEENGWVFCRKGVVLPEIVGKEAVKAVAALGLDFGGVDMLHKPWPGKAMVLEVNTAPGLDYEYGIEAYTEAFKEHIAQY